MTHHYSMRQDFELYAEHRNPVQLYKLYNNPSLFLTIEKYLELEIQK